MEQMAKYYYWSMLGARTAASSLRSWPPPARAGGGEPSWEEMAFARDAAAGHLVWPPRSYTCTFCRREFRSAQALGGHMNVHRRDRARLRQCASPDHDVIIVQDAPAAPPAAADHHQLQAESPLFRPKKAAVLISGPKLLSPTYCDHQTYNKDPAEEAAISTTTTTTPAPYISTAIIKESANKQLVISIPAAAAGSKQEAALAIIDEEEEIIVAEKRKRRRVVMDQQTEALPPLLFLRPLASSKGVEHDAPKVPKVVITSPSPNSLHLAGRQEVDLELRLGANPNNKVV